jgi:hypothetical protein
MHPFLGRGFQAQHTFNHSAPMPWCVNTKKRQGQAQLGSIFGFFVIFVVESLTALGAAGFGL